MKLRKRGKLERFVRSHPVVAAAWLVVFVYSFLIATVVSTEMRLDARGPYIPRIAIEEEELQPLPAQFVAREEWAEEKERRENLRKYEEARGIRRETRAQFLQRMRK
jgi:hypothetical protein